MFYLVKTPWLVRKIYHNYTWRVATSEKELYLTFDDGPHPEITRFVLEQLKRFDARATFFCIGKNVSANPELYAQIRSGGHSVGNHTQHHLNGWKTNDEEYLDDIKLAAQLIDSPLFRPPYGRIRRSQARRINESLGRNDVQVLMWDVLSGDFDQAISNEKCLQNVTNKSKEGSIIVFHDSEKAYPRLAYALPKCLEFFSSRGYRFKSL
jgi:peptidoglycan/xylan/chitin deacetylase (PgdA/CDA1 family)